MISRRFHSLWILIDFQHADAPTMLMNAFALMARILMIWTIKLSIPSTYIHDRFTQTNCSQFKGEK